jgi:multidrug resistance efflux pump
MNASLLPVSVPTRHGVVRRTFARIAPVLLLAGLAVWWIGRGGGRGTGQARGFSEAIPLAVASTAGGRLVEVAVRVGQAVKAGDVIARLDGQPLEIQRRKLEAERGLLAAKLAAETNREGDAVMRNEARILWTSADAHQDKAALADIENEVTRLEGLLGDQLVKASDVEPIRRERDGLAARVGTLERARAAGQAGLDGKRDVRTGAERQAIVDLRTAPLREALHIKEIKLAQVSLQLGSLTLRAPGDGIVGAINRRPGEMLAAGEAAVLLIAHRPGLFEIYLSDREQRLPAVGTHVRLTRTGILARPSEGRVVEVSPEIVELPMRLRLSPGVPGWGRRVVVDASQSEAMRAVPAGEEVRVRL